ncbi:NAD(P)-binding protein [Cyathus striatus]|nr:NAD(P)-binding protein [Cyathus striatus]
MSSPKVWFVTGASSGFGLSVINYVLEKDDIAVATLRKPEVLADLSTKYDTSRLLILELDVTKPDEITAAFATAHVQFGRIDIVYSNAGHPAKAEIEGTPDEVAREMFEVNFWGAANVGREAIRVFRDVNKPAGGRLLQASSMAGLIGMHTFGYYCASKFAIDGLFEALSKEIHPSWNIKVTLLQFGVFKTRAIKPESMVDVPLHPAYADCSTVEVRKNFPGDDIGDSDKAARAIYHIANDSDVPLRVSLGEDALSFVQEKIKMLGDQFERSKMWAGDLK